MYVRITNNGLGTMIVDRLILQKDGKTYTAIDDCLETDCRSYTRIDVNESVRKVILPSSYLVVFETRVDPQKDEVEVQQIKQQISPITLQVECRGIYDNKFMIERDFK